MVYSKNILPRRLTFVHVFLLGLVLRLAYLVQASCSNEILDFPIVDARVYVNWAQNILAGHLLWYEPINYTPMYPFYLAGCFLLCSKVLVIFVFFHLLGSLQAVMIGKIAGLLWNRRTGLVAALLAATYWPFIVHEATFYAENLALWTLAAGLFLTILYAREQKQKYLLLAGLFLGISSMSRVNTLLCLGAISGWLAWRTIRNGAERQSLSRRLSASVLRLCLLLMPVALLSLPVMWWNLKLTGAPMLRTQAAECLYLGNEPDLGGLIVSPGSEWTALEITPLLAGSITSVAKEKFWLDKTVAIVKGRTSEWIKLQGKKLIMLLGNYEVSQEIDIYRFRDSSWVLKLPFWPGFGAILPLALAGIFLSIRRRESSAVLLWICACAYLVSILPFQVSSRFRLLLVVPLLPFAAKFLVNAAEQLTGRPTRNQLLAGVLLMMGYMLVLPDHTDLGRRNTIDHWLFVGQKRVNEGDKAGAADAFAISAKELPDHSDSLVALGYVYLSVKDFGRARASFQEARRRQEGCTEALLGLAGCAAREGHDEEAVSIAAEVLRRWPKSLETLKLLQGIYYRQGNWPALEQVLLEMSSYVNKPPDVTFQLARTVQIMGDHKRAVILYDEVAATVRYGAGARSQAALYAGMITWRISGDAAGAKQRWAKAFDLGDRAFSPIAGYLLGKTTPAQLASACESSAWQEMKMHLVYAMGLAAWMRGDRDEARKHLEAVVSSRNAAQLKQNEIPMLESWAVDDLAHVK